MFVVVDASGGVLVLVMLMLRRILTQRLFSLPNSWPFNCALNTWLYHILEKHLLSIALFKISIRKLLQLFKHTWNELIFPFHPHTLEVCDGVNDKVTKTALGTKQLSLYLVVILMCSTESHLSIHHPGTVNGEMFFVLCTVMAFHLADKFITYYTIRWSS